MHEYAQIKMFTILGFPNIYIFGFHIYIWGQLSVQGRTGYIYIFQKDVHVILLINKLM